MELESILIRATSPADVRRLVRAGGEVWQEHYQGMSSGRAHWRSSLVKVPAAVAIQLQLVTLGAVTTAPSGAPRER